MQQVWRSVRWVAGKLFFFVALLITAILLVRMPFLLGARTRSHLAYANWLQSVRLSLVNLLHGRLVPQVTNPGSVKFWRQTVSEIRPELMVTLQLVGTALVVGMLLGLCVGWAMSRLGPAKLRGAAWGTTTLIGSVPDLLVATAFDLGLVLIGRAMGFNIWANDVRLYQKFIGPVLALSLLIVPYVARVTAAAIAEISGQLYVRTALAKGVPFGRVTLQHVGKNVLIKVWTVLPVIMGMLLSGTVMVEYMTEVHGLGRGLALLLVPAVRTPYTDSYAALLKLLPLLVIMTLAIAASEAGLRWLDPRMREPGAAAGRERMGLGAGKWHLRDVLRSIVRLPGALWRSLTGVPARLLEWLSDLPRQLWEALKALKDPVLLLGTLLVLGLVVVAVFAPRLAPFPWTKGTLAFQDKAGKIWAPPFGPGGGHPLGVDDIGRDILSQVIFGTRYAMLFAALVVPARFLLALCLGLAAAWWGGIWEKLVNWLGVFFTAVPQIVVPLIALFVFNAAYFNEMALCVAWGVFWVALPAVPRLAASIKQIALTVFTSPFLEGAVASGAGTWRILFRHVLPQMTAQIVTMMALEVPQALTLTATLSYFRMAPGGWIFDQESRGVPRIAEWGSMMGEPLKILLSGHWWFWAPFAALFVAVLAFNLFGEGLRRRLSRSTEWQLQR